MGLEDLPPTAIYVKEKTLLCRWDSVYEDKESEISDGFSSSDSSDDDENAAVAAATVAPPRAPRRRITMLPKKRSLPPRKKISSPDRKVMKHRGASLASGIDIGSIKLQSVEFSPTTGKPVVVELASPLSNIIALAGSGGQQQDAVTAVFCIRRAGCGNCREHGLQLTEMSKRLGVKVNVVGIVKETDQDEAGLKGFYSDYFSFPLYKDSEWDSFRFLGDRKVSLWRMLKTGPSSDRRQSKQKIRNQAFGGDQFTQGGIMLFDKAGQLKYVYYERYGDELDIEALGWAIQECAQSSTTNAQSPTFSSPLVTETAPRLPTRRQSGSHHQESNNNNNSKNVNTEDPSDISNWNFQKWALSPAAIATKCTPEGAPRPPMRRQSGSHHQDIGDDVFSDITEEVKDEGPSVTTQGPSVTTHTTEDSANRLKSTKAPQMPRRLRSNIFKRTAAPQMPRRLGSNLFRQRYGPSSKVSRFGGNVACSA